MLRKCVYFEQKSTQTEKSYLSECSFSCFHGCERVNDFFKVSPLRVSPGAVRTSRNPLGTPLVRSLQRRFRLTTSCCVSEIFAIKSRSFAKWRRNFAVLGAKFRVEPKFMTEFYKSWSPSNMQQGLVTIGQAISEIRRRKKRNK